MVLLTGLDSVIESLYLKERLTNQSKSGNILINPVNVTYTTGKTIVINHKYYPLDWIKQLVKNRNKVITRLNFNIPGSIFDPYILRINDNILSSGEYVDLIGEGFYQEVEYKFDGTKLYYPIPRSFYDHHLGDSLTALGYLSFQLGCDISDVCDSLYKNLNVIKLKNGIII